VVKSTQPPTTIHSDRFSLRQIGGLGDRLHLGATAADAEPCPPAFAAGLVAVTRAGACARARAGTRAAGTVRTAGRQQDREGSQACEPDSSERRLHIIWFAARLRLAGIDVRPRRRSG
jgi:hypothetical protein